MGNSGTALGIIAIILCAGVGVFVFFIWNGQNTINSDIDDLKDQVNDLKTMAVGIWDLLGKNMDYSPHDTSLDWLIEFKDNNLTNSEYISVSNGNTRITLLTAGWYRIHLSIVFTNFYGSTTYRTALLKDGVVDEYFDIIVTSSTIYLSPYYIDSSVFVYSNGTNYIDVNQVAFSPADGLYIFGGEGDSQFIVEYVAS